MQTTEASASAHSSKVQVFAWDRGVVGGANTDGKTGEVGGAGEGVSTLLGIVGCTGDGGVVVVDGIVAHEEESGSGVGDGGVAGLGVSLAADFVRGGWVFPETVG